MKKVAIVGVEGSGKTVMLAGLGDLYTYPDEEGYFLVPKNFGTAAYVADKIARMRNGEWPSATAGDEIQGLDWTLMHGEPGARRPPAKVCEVSFLDFAGEVYRTAFGMGGGDASLSGQAEELRRYVREADDLLVLINLRDVITGGLADKRMQEAMWITNSILDAALGEDEGRKAPRAAIVLSQADSYAETIKSCGGALGVLQKHLPYVANNYGWLDVFSANAVDKTVLDADGNVVPDKDFTAAGLLPIMRWIRRGHSNTSAESVVFKALSPLLRWIRRGDSVGAKAKKPNGWLVNKFGDVKTLVLPGGARMEMIYCAPGEFMMGSPGRYDSETQHKVKLTRGFWLGKYPVTQEQWASVMGSNPSNFKGDARLPVDSVSWDDCKEFVEKVNSSARQQLGGEARFPTEAEWEYACRAGTATAYFWGNALNGDKANCDGRCPCGTTSKGPYLTKTTPVGRYGANPWGFCDMHGNVWEWCADWYGDYSGDAVDPTGQASGDARVLRGGSWSDYARRCCSAFRIRDNPGYRYSYYGFRLCCSAGPRGGAEQ